MVTDLGLRISSFTAEYLLGSVLFKEFKDFCKIFQQILLPDKA